MEYLWSSDGVSSDRKRKKRATREDGKRMKCREKSMQIATRSVKSILRMVKLLL